ncbi:MAG: TolB family protein, partial [Gemmatimonadota bacterium]
ASEIRLPRFGQIFNPTWSPEGGRIAFAANQGGLLDLWVVDLASGELRRLTDDPFAELHPDWSPDGRRIAFVTDRFGGDMGRLEYGDYRLATVDPESRTVRRLPGFEDAKHVSPNWGPDGEDLYFVSDRNGISNVYRLDTSEGRLFQVTDLYTGVSGITALSPSLSVAARSGRMAFSVFREGGYDIYRTDDPDVLAGGPPDADDGRRAATLPPAERGRSEVAALLEDPELGLPSPVTFDSADYDPELGLDYVSQPSLAFGASSYGTFISGGASFHFSDMLGYHSLSTQLQLSIQNGTTCCTARARWPDTRTGGTA